MPRIRDLKALEVSLVPKAANKKEFLILKSFEGSGNESMEKILKILETKMDNDEKLEAIMKALSDDAKQAMMGAMRLLRQFKDELPEGMWQNMMELVGMPVMQQEPKKDPMSMADPITKADIDKMDVSEEVKVMLKALWKENDDMVKKTADLESLVQKAEDEKLTAKYVGVAKSFTNLSVDPKEFGKVLKEIAENAPEAMAKVQEVLKGADEALQEAGIFKEFGSSGTSTAGAWDKIEAFAEEIMKEDTKITKEEAITKAMEQNQELYSQYLQERGEM